jgi:hypothetical protein
MAWKEPIGSSTMCIHCYKMIAPYQFGGWTLLRTSETTCHDNPNGGWVHEPNKTDEVFDTGS